MSDEGQFRMADMQFSAGMRNKADPQQFALFVGLLHLNTATELSLGAISSRIERLHQKIDRIEKKLGSVR